MSKRTIAKGKLQLCRKQDKAPIVAMSNAKNNIIDAAAGNSKTGLSRKKPTMARKKNPRTRTTRVEMWCLRKTSST